MPFVSVTLIFVTASCLGLFAGLMVRRVGSPRSATRVLALMGVLALVFFALHYNWAINYASNYGVNHPDRAAGMYPALQAFRLLAPMAGLLWLAGILLATRRLPASIALSPVLFFGLYWFLGLQNIAGESVGVHLDNVPTVILFLFCLSISTFGLVFAFSALGSKRALGPNSPNEF